MNLLWLDTLTGATIACRRSPHCRPTLPTFGAGTLDAASGLLAGLHERLLT